MCMMFGCNPQMNFYRLFHSLNLVIFGLPSTKAYIHLAWPQALSSRKTTATGQKKSLI